MSTEWHFFAFEHDAFASHVLTPIFRAVNEEDHEAWFQLLTKLEEVHPRSSVSKYGLRGQPHSVTALEWYTGLPSLPIDRAPAPDSLSLKALLKLCLESLAANELVGSCCKPSGVFSELGFPEQLLDPGERALFLEQSTKLFHRSVPLPEPYRFLGDVNQGVGVLLAAEVRQIVEAESVVGLWRRLGRELQETEWRALACDLRSLRPFLEQAGNDGLSVYYSEDGT